MGSNQNINFERYVALGDSLTAGYADGALYHDAQQYSYVNILAEQFRSLGGGTFRQPLVDPTSVGINQHNNSRLVLKKNSASPRPNIVSLAYLADHGDADILLKNIYVAKGPFNNLGIPGAKITSALIAGYGNYSYGTGNYNPFFARIAANVTTSSILSDALALDPTFFSLFMGNNDALTYALSGATEDSITPVNGPPGSGFKESLDFILNELTRKGAKGVIANIPDVMTVPFFNAIPYNGLLLDSKTAADLTNKYRSGGVSFQTGQNPFVVSEPTAQGNKTRLMKKGELILMDLLLDLDQAAFLKAELPMPKKYFLLASEVATIQRAIQEYNIILESAARTRGLTFVNINSLLKRTKRDRHYNSEICNLEYRKGVFSLDGLHPNPLGHVMLANQFIKAINQTYQTDISFASIEPYKELSFSQFEHPH